MFDSPIREISSPMKPRANIKGARKNMQISMSESESEIKMSESKVMKV